MKQTNNPNDSLPFHIRRAFRGFETALSRYLKTVGLSPSQFYILRLQWNAVGVQQNEIAEQACMSESVASQVIQKMEKSGLLEREADKNDSRKQRVLLTAKGAKLREEIMTEGIQISKEHAPKISREDMMTTISVLIEVKRAFKAFNEAQTTD